MAKEMFLVDYDVSLADPERNGSLERYAYLLGKLGVGQDDVPAMIFRPEAKPYVADAKLMAEKMQIDSIYRAEFLARHWTPPFRNGVEMNICLIAQVAHILGKQRAALAPEQAARMVVMAPPDLAAEYLRHHPSGISTEYFNADRDAPQYSHYYIQHMSIPNL